MGHCTTQTRVESKCSLNTPQPLLSASFIYIWPAGLCLWCPGCFLSTQLYTDLVNHRGKVWVTWNGLDAGLYSSVCQISNLPRGSSTLARIFRPLPAVLRWRWIVVDLEHPISSKIANMPWRHSSSWEGEHFPGHLLCTHWEHCCESPLPHLSSIQVTQTPFHYIWQVLVDQARL